jgi:hypothetical protein
MSEVSSPSQNNVYTIRQQNLASKVVRRVYISTNHITDKRNA